MLDTKARIVKQLIAISTNAKQATWYYDKATNKLYLFVQTKGLWIIDAKTFSIQQVQLPDKKWCDFFRGNAIPSDKPNEFIFFPRGYHSIFLVNTLTNKIEKTSLTNDQNAIVLTEIEQLPTGNFIALVGKNKQNFIWEFTIKNKQALVLKEKKVEELYWDPFYKKIFFIPASNKIMITDGEKGILFYDTSFNLTAAYPNNLILSTQATAVNYTTAFIKDNILWIASDPYGLAYCNLQTNKFNLYKWNNSATSSVVKGIFTDEKENVYSCLLFDGVQVFDKNGNHLNEFKNIGENGKKPLILQAFNTFLPINKDSVFIFSYNFLGFYNTKTGVSKDYYQQFKQQTNNYRNYASFFQGCNIKSTNDWLLTSDSCLYKSHFTATNISTKFIAKFNSTVSAVYCINNEKYLIGTEAGLYIYNNNKPELLPFSKGAFIKHINYYQNNFWISTTNGLWQLNEKLELIKQYTTDNGLPNNFIYGTVNENNNLWMSTNYGLSCINLVTKKINNYTVNDGIQSNEFNSNAFWKCPHTGKIYFGGINGITAITNTINTQQHQTFKTKILKYTLNDTTTFFNIPTVIENKYWQNTISFQFVGLFPAQSSQLFYRYQLKNFDKDWFFAGKERVARYASLPPGKYEFIVQSSLNENDWYNEPDSIIIIIHPPFWKTWWFSILLVAINIFLVWKIWNYVLQQKNKKQMQQLKLQESIEEERQRISRDLHDNMGAYTSALLYNVQQLQQNNAQPNVVNKMQQNAEQILSSLRETIWVLNNQSVTIADFSDGFKNYCFKILRNFDYINFESAESIESNITIPSPKAIHLNKILQEIIQNIIKHAQCTQINYQCTSLQKIKFIIADNGKGFNEENILKGNGIDNMQWRAKEAGFTITIQSQLQKGTQIILEQV